MNESRHQGDDTIPRQCACKSCGESFRHGSEGDNEHYHLRCEREEQINNFYSLTENSEIDFDRDSDYE